MTKRKKVAFLTLILPHYRKQFHELVRSKLSTQGINYELVYGQPQGDMAARRDTVDIPWATKIQNVRFQIGRQSIYWQRAWSRLSDADLVIIGQENLHLINYPLQLTYLIRGRKIALFGHGRNFQAKNPNSPAERFKRFWATKAHWWFAYTEDIATYLASIGFPQDRITVVNNAIDTNLLRRQLDTVTEADIRIFQNKIGVKGGEIGIFIGGLYSRKRLEFLIEAADRIKELRPNFHLLVIGAGPDLDKVHALASHRPYVHVLGPRMEQDKAIAMAAAKVFLIPGLVGLAILDAYASGLPIVTTAVPFHSPEIAYLEDGVQGTIVHQTEDLHSYAKAVADLLADPVLHARMATAARRSSSYYTIERMAEHFSDGVMNALNMSSN